MSKSVEFSRSERLACTSQRPASAKEKKDDGDDTLLGEGDSHPDVNRSTRMLDRLEQQQSASDIPLIDHKNSTLRNAPINLGAASSAGALFADTPPETRLRTRLEDILQERDSYQELLRDAISRIFHLENRLKQEEQHPEVELIQQKAMEIYRKSKTNITALNTDIADLRHYYKTEKNAKDNMRLQLVASQKELELAKTTLKMQENGLDSARDTIKRLTDEAFGLQQAVATAQTTITTLKQEKNARMKDEQVSVERNLLLAQKCEELERRNKESMNKLEEAVDFGEKAVRSRDQLASRLREYATEITELRHQDTKTYTELTERSKKELQHLKQTSEEALAQQREDIRQLEAKLTDKDIEISRWQREIKALQNHIERNERETLTLHTDMSTPEDLMRRLLAAEQDRDRLTLLVQSTQISLRQKIDQMGTQEQKFEKNMKAQNERLKETVNQCEKLNKEHVDMAEEIHRLEGQLVVKEKSIQALNRDIQAEIFTLKEKNRIAEADRLARETAMEESQKQGLVDMHQVNKLLRQQVAHWQAEVRGKLKRMKPDRCCNK
ncbi:hypothetical protein RvY_06583-2 [Ramazzottius varieornatus]|uniref:Uncharacterized protein n=1 Tax=Ramazzottius varieornatus TaxID=947166 RepID=A0A1D1UZI6_RAMVA|nr:hypothetical protein RvY_06583-2 [Ramazzottius varieornatus]